MRIDKWISECSKRNTRFGTTGWEAKNCMDIRENCIDNGPYMAKKLKSQKGNWTSVQHNPINNDNRRKLIKRWVDYVEKEMKRSIIWAKEVNSHNRNLKKTWQNWMRIVIRWELCKRWKFDHINKWDVCKPESV